MTPIEQQIEGIVDSILQDYQNHRDIDKLNPFQQPDKTIVIDMIDKLLRIVYPGFYRDRRYRIYNAKHNLSMLIEDVMYNLNKQIAIVLGSMPQEANPEAKAQELSLAFFREIPQVRQVVQTDVEAFYQGDPAAFRHCGGRDHGDRGSCEGLPGGDPGSPDHPGGPESAGQEAPSHH